MSQGKFWCLTLNNYSEDEYNTLKNLNVKYLIIGKEIGENETPHLQGYIEFETNQRLNALKRINNRIHWETRRGTSNEAAEYCKKDGDYFEKGSLSVPRQGQRNDILAAKQIARDTGSMKQVVENVNSFQAIRVAEMYLKYVEKKRNWLPEVKWYYGITGSGKTRAAMEESNDPYVSGKNLRWWDGYDGQEDVIIDDFRKDFCTFHELLRILDRYEYRVEVKGGSRQLLAKRIWITSCFRPQEVYDTREDIGQLIRRISEIKIFGMGSGMEVRGNTDPDFYNEI